MGKHVLRIDTTKVGNGEAFVAEDPVRCPLDKLIDGVQLVGTHDGEVTDLSMCQWMRNRLVSASQDGTVCIFLVLINCYFLFLPECVCVCVCVSFFFFPLNKREQKIKSSRKVGRFNFKHTT